MISRVRYRERQILRHQDMVAEQSYRVEQHRRHVVGAHSAGFVSGLRLAHDEYGLRVTAGLVVDDLGRDLVLAEDVVVPFYLLADDALNGGDIAVYLAFASEQPSPGRIVETAHLHLVRANELPAAELYAVLLGRVAVAGKLVSVLPEPARPASRMVGGAVITPDERVKMELSSGRLGGLRPFVVSTREDVDRAWHSRFAVHHSENSGTTTAFLQDTAKVRGDLSVANVALRKPQPSGDVARQWAVYRVEEEEQRAIHVELAHPGDTGDASRYQFVIGFEEEGVFLPIFMVRADKTVYAFGHLEMRDGEITELRLLEDDETFALLDGDASNDPEPVAPASVAPPPVNVLQLRVSDVPETVVVGNDFPYSVTVQNVSDMAVRGVTVSEILGLQGRTSPRREVANAFDLEAGAVKTVAATLTIPRDLEKGFGSIVVVAVGNDAENRPMQVATQRTFQIEDGYG